MIAVCVKAMARFPLSHADQAAVEWALRAGEHTGSAVEVFTVAAPDATRALRHVLACGAARATLLATTDELTSWDTATALAGRLGDARQVWCGDLSTDRGSGSVPAFLADLLDVQQALGCVTVEHHDDCAVATRRLDGGRRELVRVDGPAVISVEGAAAELRRASLPASLAAERADIDVVALATNVPLASPAVPYRPRAQQLAAPQGESALARTAALLFGGSPSRRGETVELAPAAAARRIVAALTEWQYLDPAATR